MAVPLLRNGPILTRRSAARFAPAGGRDKRMAWTHLDGESLYNVPNWGRGYFRINAEGNVEVTPEGPDRPNSPGIDLYKLIGQILRRGIAPPILFRFDGILRG